MGQMEEMVEAIKFSGDVFVKLVEKGRPNTSVSESGRIIGMENIGQWREDCESLRAKITACRGMTKSPINYLFFTDEVKDAFYCAERLERKYLYNDKATLPIKS